MENNFLLTDDLLWDYTDGFLSPPQQQQVEVYLQSHPEWAERLNHILAEKQDLFSLTLETPNAGFADTVMAAWAAEHVGAKAKAKGGDWIIRLIAVVFGLFILVPVVVMVFAALEVSPDQLPSFELPALPAVDWAAWATNSFLQYGLLLTLAFAGLRFLEKLLQHRQLAHQLGH